MAIVDWINPDHFLQTPQRRLFTPARSREAWQAAHAGPQDALARHRAAVAGPMLRVVCGLQGAGKSSWIRDNAQRLAPCIFFDAAPPRAMHRAPLRQMAREAGVRCTVVKVDLETALARNRRRGIDEQVPEAAVVAVAGQFETPALEEGFEEILVVS